MGFKARELEASAKLTGVTAAQVTVFEGAAGIRPCNSHEVVGAEQTIIERGKDHAWSVRDVK